MEPSKTQIRIFDKSYVAKQIKKRKYDIPVDLLYPYSAGSPHLVDVLAKHIQNWRNGARPNWAWFLERQEAFQQILQTYEHRLLDHVGSDLRQILVAITPLRAYRLEALRFMLSKQEVSPGSDGYYLGILRKLDQKTGVVRWSRERRAYVTDEMVRRVINRRLLLADSKTYIEQHNQALEMYWQWALEFPETCEEFIIEIWFHLASICQVKQNPVCEFRNEAEQALIFAREHLSNDRFLILQNLIDNELRDFLTDEIHDELMLSLNKKLSEKLP